MRATSDGWVCPQHGADPTAKTEDRTLPTEARQGAEAEFVEAAIQSALNATASMWRDCGKRSNGCTRRSA